MLVQSQHPSQEGWQRPGAWLRPRSICGGREAVGGEPAVGTEDPWALGPFLPLAACRGTSVGQLHLLLVASEQVLAPVCDTEGPGYCPCSCWSSRSWRVDFLTGTSAGETAGTGTGSAGTDIRKSRRRD